MKPSRPTPLALSLAVLSLAVLAPGARGQSASTAAAAQAQVASLVADINQQTEPGDGVAMRLGELAIAGDRLVFEGFDTIQGEGLWASDGTFAGTEPLTDDIRGARLVATTRKLTFWEVDDGVLWRSDGTRAGTFPLLSGVSADSSPWIPRGDVLFFPGCDRTRCGLWRTDGTVTGTREILDLHVRTVAVLGNLVLAVTDTGEIWRLDPDSEAPVLVTNVGVIGFIAALRDRLVMQVFDNHGDQELWGSDGTAAGTRPLTQFPNHDPFDQRIFISTGRRLYFVADDTLNGNELWISDGTPQGTRRITDFGYDSPFQLGMTLQEIGNRVVFAATDGTSSPDPWVIEQLWVTDGRPESTRKLLTPCPHLCGPDRNVLFSMVRAGNVLLLIADDESHGTELWTTDGTPEGTRLFKDLCPGACDSGVAFVPSIPAGGGVYFTARNHLWRTDATAAGTRRLTNRPQTPSGLGVPRIAVVGGKTFVGLGPGPAGSGGRSSLRLLEGGELLPLSFGSPRRFGSDPRNLLAQGGELFFLASDGFESGLWKTAGSAATTRLHSRDSFGDMLAAGGIIYLLGLDELWRVTGDGLQHLADLGEDQSSSAVSRASALDPHLYFKVTRNDLSEIWKTDGTVAETGPLMTLPEGQKATLVTASAGRLYFEARNEPAESASLWTSDGTAAGTREILVLPQRRKVHPRFVRVGNSDYFFLEDTALFYLPRQLWRTDGTPAGTRQILLPDTPSADMENMVAQKGWLLLLATVPFAVDGELVLWRLDGDTAVRLRTFGRLRWVWELAAAGDLILFNMFDGEHGLELWATDGTAAGTRLVRDIVPGEFSAVPAHLTAAGGRVFFTAQDNVHGVELWESDGTAAGTRLVHDIAPGPLSSHPERLTAADGRLYFTADDGLTGRELWTLPLTGPGGCQPSDRALCLRDNRFRVEASWRDFEQNTGTGTAVSLTGDTGYFWFFDPSNAEVILKVLDGRGLNNHFWVFYGALSTVEYTLTVTDTATGLTQRYFNPKGQLASVGDTTGFGPDGAFVPRREPLVASPSPPALVRGWTSAAAASGICQPGPRRLCLHGNRFAVEASWKDFAGETGQGTAVPLSGDFGYFWFFDAANVEVLLKVLDGTPVNGKFWVFYGALSNVEYTLKVTDTETGAVKEYKNPSGRFGSVADTGAFE